MSILCFEISFSIYIIVSDVHQKLKSVLYLVTVSNLNHKRIPHFRCL